MKKIFLIVIIVVFAFALIIVILPKVTTKETCTYRDAIQQFAKGKFVTIEGKKVHFVEKGSGKPIILIHGFLYHTVMWKKNIDALAKKFKVYAIDLWGWGYSERLAPKELSFELYGRQITGFMDAMNIRKATLVGQSMGGGISVYVAAHHPKRVDRLILVDPAVIPYPSTAISKIYQLPFFGEFLNAIPGNALMRSNIESLWFYDKEKVSEAYVEEVIQPQCIKGTSAGAMYILRKVLQPPLVESEANLLAKMKKPILIVHGREDKAVPLDKSQSLKNLWKGSKLEVFNQAAHSPHEEYPDRFNKLAIEFLSE
jgi:pimeloyl-ACP methyl ester carboxylesterase